MSGWARRYALGGILGASLISSALIGGAFAPRPVLAKISSCRHDPVVFLSNNTKVQLSVDIGTYASQVGNISFALTVPRGVRAMRIVYTQGPLGRHESITLTASNNQHLYDSATLVASSQAATVTAAMQVVNQSTNSDSKSSASGMTNQVVTIQMDD